MEKKLRKCFYGGMSKKYFTTIKEANEAYKYDNIYRVWIDIDTGEEIGRGLVRMQNKAFRSIEDADKLILEGIKGKIKTNKK